MTLTPKQAAFVREYLVDRNATQAAIRAGYSAHTATEQGCRLLTNVHVQRAVEVKEQRLQAKAEVTIESIATQLDEDRAFAKECGQPGAAVSATLGKAKLYGLIVEKRQVETTTRSLKEMTTDELFALLGRGGKGGDNGTVGGNAEPAVVH